MNVVSRRDNIHIQPLPNEVVLYDKGTHQAHCLNPTVFKVWESADGTRSVDQLAQVLDQGLDIGCRQEVVLLALDELRKANLLQDGSVATQMPLPSRREVARKLSAAGLSLSVLPLVASLVAPTPAMARSGNYSAATYQQEYAQATSETSRDLTALLRNKNGSYSDLTSAISDGQSGIIAAVNGKQTLAQTDFMNAETEFNDMLNALGLPPL